MRSILVLLAAAAAASDDKTHVVVAGSGSHALGVVACVRSVFEGALNQVKVHVIVQKRTSTTSTPHYDARYHKMTGESCPGKMNVWPGSYRCGTARRAISRTR